MSDNDTPTNPSVGPLFPLWKMLHDEHGLILLDSELRDIIYAAREVDDDERVQRIADLERQLAEANAESDKWREAYNATYTKLAEARRDRACNKLALALAEHDRVMHDRRARKQLEEARQRITDESDAKEAWAIIAEEHELTIVDLERQLAEARRDKERLDWLEKNQISVSNMKAWWKEHAQDGGPRWWVVQGKDQVCGNLARRQEMRAAIDAAMKEDAE